MSQTRTQFACHLVPLLKGTCRYSWLPQSLGKEAIETFSEGWHIEQNLNALLTGAPTVQLSLLTLGLSTLLATGKGWKRQKSRRSQAKAKKASWVAATRCKIHPLTSQAVWSRSRYSHASLRVVVSLCEHHAASLCRLDDPGSLDATNQCGEHETCEATSGSIANYFNSFKE